MSDYTKNPEQEYEELLRQDRDIYGEGIEKITFDPITNTLIKQRIDPKTTFKDTAGSRPVGGKVKKYWYRIYVGECPVCGRDAGYRERVYGDPPSDKEEQYVYMSGQETYCGCEEH